MRPPITHPTTSGDDPPQTPSLASPAALSTKAAGVVRSSARRRILSGAVATVLVATTSLLTAGAAQGVGVTVDPTPRALRLPPPGEDSNVAAAIKTSLDDPTRDPTGANDWSCQPSAAHPEPVILLHGTWECAYENWNGLAPILKDQGYCVYALNYGAPNGVSPFNAVGDMVQAADEITAFVQRVVQTTGAEHVALVGHSQGGAQARYVTNLLLPRGLVTKVIALGPTNHGTTLSGLTRLATVMGVKKVAFSVLNALDMPAAAQQGNPKSPFYVNLNGNGETIPGVDYTVIATKHDEISTPYKRAFITAGPGATVDNITLPDGCRKGLSDHFSMSYSKNVAQIVLNKLDPEHPHAILCYPQLPILGSTNAKDRCGFILAPIIRFMGLLLPNWRGQCSSLG